MTQIGSNTYRVQPGERVTVTIEAFQVINAATFVMDVAFIAPPRPPTWQFDVSQPAGGFHNGIVDYAFPIATPPSAHYTTLISGSAGGSFIGPTVFPNSLLQHGFMFQVV